MTSCTKQLVKIVLSDTPTKSLSFFRQWLTSLENAKNSNSKCKTVTTAVVIKSQGLVSVKVRLISSNSAPAPFCSAAWSIEAVMEAKMLNLMLDIA